MTNPNYIQKLSLETIADVLTFVPGLERTKIITRLYDGSRHVQTIGITAPYANVEIFAYQETISLLNAAEAQAELLRLVYKETAYFGYIEAPISWNAAIKGMAYTASIKFLIEG